jgi:hypothetical protein
MFEPRYDQEDLPRFVDYLENQLAKDEQVIRLEIINDSIATWISVEPTGASDEFPVGSKYEVVALIRKNEPNLTIKTGKTHIIVYAYDIVWVFNNGVATMACQY